MSSSTAKLPPDEIRRRAAALGDWFHNIDLGGVRTAPDHFLGDYPAVKWRSFAHAIPADLAGKTVLDIGCNGGFYSMEMKKRGAARVLGVDWDEDYLAQARFAAEVTGLDIEFRKLSVKQKDYVKSAEMMGEPQWRIMTFEIFPNVISIVGINFIGSVIFAIITEATLEFLGLGDPRVVSWGTMLYNAQKASALSVGAWWDILTPCFALAFLGIGMSLLNFAVDEIANPRLRTGNHLKRWSLLIRSGEGRL